MVLFASYSGAFGGAERLLLEFARAFEPAAALACPQGPLAEAARSDGFAVFSLQARSLHLRRRGRDRLSAGPRLLAHGAELRRLVRNLDPELVIAWGMRSAIACLLGTRLPCPFAFQHNDLLPGPAIGRIVRIAAARAEVSFALSHAIAEDLDPGRRLGDRLKVVHPGVDVERFASEAEPARTPEVLVLGAIAGWKRPDLALEACAIARRQQPELRLRLVGAPLDERGERLLARLRERAGLPDLKGSVELAGASADVSVDLARASCLLHCAEREPFGMAVLEAIAAGRPAVVPAAAGPAEIVDSSCGVLYRPGDAHAAAQALIEVLSDPQRARQWGAAGRARARTSFDLGDARERYGAVVRPLLARRGERAGPGPALGLVTVTHNSAGQLRALLESVQRHLPGARVVVVDCASQDQTLEIADRFRFTRTVALAENIGFGRGCNRGLCEIDEPVVALLNPDVELVDDSLLALASEAARRDRQDRLLAPLVLNPDGARQDSVHPPPTSPADLFRSLVPPAIVVGRLGVALAPWRASTARRVGWAVGAAVVARADVLRRLGPFDERIFLYGEDLDLGLRAAEQGVETWFWPSARVIHHRAHATGPAFGGEPFELLAGARHEVVARRLGAGRARLDDAAQALTFASRAALKRALGRDAERERHQLTAIRRVRT
jgi:GT2 family glycosyltransferase/glycosyltransferase involved in cell wall biosynthesis